MILYYICAQQHSGAGAEEQRPVALPPEPARRHRSRRGPGGGGRRPGKRGGMALRAGGLLYRSLEPGWLPGGLFFLLLITPPISLISAEIKETESTVRMGVCSRARRARPRAPRASPMRIVPLIMNRYHFIKQTSPLIVRNLQRSRCRAGQRPARRSPQDPRVAGLAGGER